MTEAAEATTPPVVEAEKVERHRLQFEFSSDAYQRLQRIKDETHASSFAELIRNSLRLYEWIMQQEREGYGFGLVKDDKLVKEVKLVF